jgi:hypothetical protein
VYRDTLVQLGTGATAEKDSLSEPDELNGLRRAMAELTRERDALKRSASLLIEEAMQR